jgi:hypothetical protein
VSKDFLGPCIFYYYYYYTEAWLFPSEGALVPYFLSLTLCKRVGQKYQDTQVYTARRKKKAVDFLAYRAGTCGGIEKSEKNLKWKKEAKKKPLKLAKVISIDVRLYTPSVGLPPDLGLLLWLNLALGRQKHAQGTRYI